MEASSKYKPIEVTTHNIYFHEDSPILSTDCYENIMATSGFDKCVRIWNIIYKEMKYRDNTYKTAANSSITLEFSHELTGFNYPINCVRFYKNDLLKINSYLLACCSDNGKVIVYYGLSSYTIREKDTDDAYDLHWMDDSLVIGFRSGRIEVYKISIEKLSVPEIQKHYDSAKKLKINISEAKENNSVIDNDTPKEHGFEFEEQNSANNINLEN